MTIGIAPPSAVAEFHDRNNNPKTAALIYRNILRAADPSKIEKLVDRSVNKFNFTRPLQILNHTMICAGYRFVYKFDNPGAVMHSSMIKENMRLS